MQPNKHRTWAEIDLGAIEHNYRVICEAAKAPVLCVVKADCYGHGAVPVANRLQSMGAPYFAVATVPEAVELRENGIEKPIIILGYIDAADMDTVAEYGITAPVYDEETAELLSAAAVRTGRDITVHYKLDTGMTRIGFPSWEREETVRRILVCAKKPGLHDDPRRHHPVRLPSGCLGAAGARPEARHDGQGARGAGARHSGAHDHQLRPHI